MQTSNGRRRPPIRERAVRLETGQHVNIQWREGEFDSLEEVLEQLLNREQREHSTGRSSTR